MKAARLFFLLALPIYLYGQEAPAASDDGNRPESVAQPASGQRLTLLFVGDLMQHQAQIDAARQPDGTYDYDHCFSLVKDDIGRADLAIGNLEVTLGGKPYRGYPQFSAPDEYLYALKDAGFDILGTANNHSLDRRQRGLERTLRLADSIGLATLGTYRDSTDRRQRYPLMVEKNGLRIALLCATYGTNGIATTPPNIVNSLDRMQLSTDIRRTRALCPDAIIAFVHWGNEYQQHPNSEQRSLARWLIGEGVDHIIGSHPHMIQPIELLPSTEHPTHHAIVYSLGNYVSNMSIPHSDVGLTVQLTLEKIAGTTRLSALDYGLVWTERAPLSRQGDFRIIPADTLPPDLTPDACQRMRQAIAAEADFLVEHNKMEDYE
ncbi:MAG: CapA family protein [Bacteroidaceae bacterium]|nr:CapA family protein [Bacteroidaceae bacterium]